MACEHHYVHSNHEGYLLCGFCRTYRSLLAVPPEDLYTEDYWTHAEGHSTLKEQAYNVDEFIINGSSKAQYVLDRIEVENRGAALEIGCAPGRLLLLLKGIGGFRNVIGIEANRAYEKDIREIGCFGGDLLFGIFPDVTPQGWGGRFDYITAIDVFEHSWDPEAFLEECARLLKPGGQLFLMLPLASKELEERFFEAKEHVFIHSRPNLLVMLTEAGFSGFKAGNWTNGHDSISARRVTDDADL